MNGHLVDSRVLFTARTAFATWIVVLLVPSHGAAQTTAPASLGVPAPVHVTPVVATPAASTTPTAAPPNYGGHVLIGSGLSLAAGIQLYITGPETPTVAAAAPVLETTVPTARWRGGVLLDEPMRDAMRLSDHDERERAASVSDAMLGATVAYSFLIDGLAAPLAQGDPQLALDSGVAFSLALGMTLVLGEIIKTSVARARPYERECIDNPQAPGCNDEDRFASFYSLHSAVAFTSAGFSCAMHLSRSLYRDPIADGMSCATSLAMATTVAVLRVAADRHYLTDVLIGSVMGMVIGYVVPLFLVPQRSPSGDRSPDHGSPTALVMPMFAPGADGSLSTSTIGLSVAGGF